MKKQDWVLKNNVWIAPTPIRPGVWRRKEGGFLVRGRTRDPRTGRRLEVRQVFLDSEDPDQALIYLKQELLASSRGDRKQPDKLPSFNDYALSLTERMVALGKMKSAKSRERWASVLKCHLSPEFGDFYIDQLHKSDVEDWLVRMGRLVQEGKYSPVTVNDWLNILRRIYSAAMADFELDRNPVAHIRDLDVSDHETYTIEQPNSLTAEELPAFLVEMRTAFPQYFAMVALGFATGLRPSSLRPLRRKGDTPDVLWDRGMLLVRRSVTAGQVMERTKTGLKQMIALPHEMMEILKWQCDRIEVAGTRQMVQSELLFPSEVGGFRAPSCLDKPFAAVVDSLGLTKKITPRAMRRTFNDLCRAAEVKDVVTRSVSGHLTEDMQRHYSTVNPVEQRESLARVVSLAKFREAFGGNLVSVGGNIGEKAADRPANDVGDDLAGETSGETSPEKTKAARGCSL